MIEVFEKIIEKLEELKKSELEREDLCDEEGCGDGEEIYEDGKSAGRYEQTVRIIEIVKQIAAEYTNGHFGCNTNGEHERCDGCCLTDCKNRNKIWFSMTVNNVKSMKKSTIKHIREVAFCLVEESQNEIQCTKNRFGNGTMDECSEMNFVKVKLSEVKNDIQEVRKEYYGKK